MKLRYVLSCLTVSTLLLGSESFIQNKAPLWLNSFKLSYDQNKPIQDTIVMPAVRARVIELAEEMLKSSNVTENDKKAYATIIRLLRERQNELLAKQPTASQPQNKPAAQPSASFPDSNQPRVNHWLTIFTNAYRNAQPVIDAIQSSGIRDQVIKTIREQLGKATISSDDRTMYTHILSVLEKKSTPSVQPNTNNPHVPAVQPNTNVPAGVKPGAVPVQENPLQPNRIVPGEKKPSTQPAPVQPAVHNQPAQPVKDETPTSSAARFDASTIISSFLNDQKTFPKLSTFDLAQLSHLLDEATISKKNYETIATITEAQQKQDAINKQKLLDELIFQLESEIAKQTTPQPAAGSQAGAPSNQPVAPSSGAKTPIGLTNIGASCFMNAALQMFLSLKDFNEIILSAKNYFIPDTISAYYQALLENLQKNNATTIKPDILCLKGWQLLGVNKSTMQDSSEFISKFIDHLLNQDRNPQYAGDTRLKQLFTIKTQTFIMGQESVKTDQTFLSILPQENTLYECLEKHFAPEELENGASKQELLLSVGNYLILSLARFKNSNGSWEKNEKPVSFPLALDSLSQFATQGAKIENYHLKSIIIHTGSMNGGHYTSYVKFNNVWYFCDDSIIRPVSNELIENFAKTGTVQEGNKNQTPSLFLYEVNH